MAKYSRLFRLIGRGAKLVLLESSMLDVLTPTRWPVRPLTSLVPPFAVELTGPASLVKQRVGRQRSWRAHDSRPLPPAGLPLVSGAAHEQRIRERAFELWEPEGRSGSSLAQGGARIEEGRLT